MASMAKVRKRNWCFTSFDEAGNQALDANTGEGSGVRFWCYGNETCPDTKRSHRQGYMELTQATTRLALQKKFHRSIHWEFRRGTQEQAIQYCQKDGDYYAFGEVKQQGKRADLIAIRDAIDAGAPVSQIATDHFAKYCQYGRAFERYRQLKQPERNWATEVHVVWGPTGTGKTRYCIDQGAAMVEFDKGGFIHGYMNQEIIVFDDFDPATISRGAFLKLMDRYPTTVNIKGGSMIWNPRTVYLTTNFNPRDWYGACPAIRRRLTSITHKATPFVSGDAGSSGASASSTDTAGGGSSDQASSTPTSTTKPLGAEIDLAHLHAIEREARAQIRQATDTYARGREAVVGDIVTL